jgi:hypothetical protein
MQVWHKVISFSGFITDRTAFAENVVDRLESKGQLRQPYLWATAVLHKILFLSTTNVGLSYGAFQNDSNMALDLSFKGTLLGG